MLDFTVEEEAEVIEAVEVTEVTEVTEEEEATAGGHLLLITVADVVTIAPVQDLTHHVSKKVDTSGFVRKPGILSPEVDKNRFCKANCDVVRVF